MTPTSLPWRQQVAQLHRWLRRGLGSTLGRNILSLYGLQFANYILPLVTVPYLVRVLGPERFGAVAFGQGLMAYFTLVVNYGFDWSATRTISVQREDREAVSRTASSVWAAKALLCLGSFLVMMVLVQTVPRLHEEAILLYLLFGIVVGNVLFPTWLFQGLERMVAISVINFVMRLLTTISVFGLIRQPSDFLNYAVLLSVQWIGAGVLGIWVSNKSLQTPFRWPGWHSIITILADGWVLFLSTGAVALYTTGNSFILGMLTDNTVVGYYSAAERLVKTAQRLLTPITQAVYPRFSKMAVETPSTMLAWARRGLILQSGVGFILSALLFLGASIITQWVLGNAYGPAVDIMRLLAPLPLLISIGSSFGQFVMLPFHRDRARLFIFAGAGIINILLAFLLTSHWKGEGMAIAVLSSELIVTVSFLVYVKKQGISPI